MAGGKALPLLGDAAHDDTAGGTGVAVIDRGHPAREVSVANSRRKRKDRAGLAF